MEDEDSPAPAPEKPGAVEAEVGALSRGAYAGVLWTGFGFSISFVAIQAIWHQFFREDWLWSVRFDPDRRWTFLLFCAKKAAIFGLGCGIVAFFIGYYGGYTGVEIIRDLVAGSLIPPRE